MDAFKNTDAIRAGWELFKKRPLLFGGVTFLIWCANTFLTTIGEALPERSLELFLYSLVAFALNMLIAMGITAFFLKAHDAPESASFADLWHPRNFLSYLVAALIFGIAAAVGFVLLIVPGLMVVVTYQFAQYLVIDRALGPIEALKESARITKGHRWELFGLFVFILGLNIVGFLFFLVGLLVSVPVTALAVVRAYRTLQKLAPAA